MATLCLTVPKRNRRSAAYRSLDDAALLDQLEAFIRRYVILTDDQAAAVALWVAHTHVFDAAEATPYLSVTSPEKASGKTRLLEVFEKLVARPWLTGGVTAASLMRKVDGDAPALLLDESDAAWAQRDYAEALRGVLNSGYRRRVRAASERLPGENSIPPRG